MAVAAVAVGLASMSALATEASATDDPFSADWAASVRTNAVATVDAPCFIQPLRWNVALDGPIPRCSRESVSAVSPLLRLAPRHAHGVELPATLDAPCFIHPLRWNVALDGPIPMCSRQETATA
jgi:hypothetical protein